MRCIAVVLALSAALLGCPIEADITGKRCPCAEGFVCNGGTDQCEAPGDAGSVDTDANVPMDTGSTDSEVDAGFADTGIGSTLVFTDDDFVDEFDQGEFNNTVWAGDRLTLAPGEMSGEFISRRFAGPVERWTTLSFLASGPYGKELPDNGSIESGWQTGNVDMSDVILLLHLDLQTAAPGNTVLSDSSGRGNDVTVLGTSGLLPAEGRVAGGAQSDGDIYMSLDLASATDLEFGESDFTWGMWIRTTQPCDRNNVYMGIRDGSGDPLMWIGCTASSGSQQCPAGRVGGRAGGDLIPIRGDPDAAGAAKYCGITVVNDGEWHHLALTKEGHSSSVVKLFVDGRIEATTSIAFTEAFSFANSPEFGIGAFGDGTFEGVGIYDEVVMFSRALAEEEVRAHYLRGALSLRFQVRECTAAGCSAFVGPGPNTSAFYGEPPQATSPREPVVIDGALNAPELQYRVLFGTHSTTDTPSLRAVTIEAIR